MYNVYARADTNGLGLVKNFFSDCFESPLDTDIVIKSGEGDEYVHVQGQFQLINTNGTHNYKIADGAMVETTSDEKAAELAGMPEEPMSQEERIAELEEQNAELLGCLLEMSEMVYA